MSRARWLSMERNALPFRSGQGGKRKNLFARKFLATISPDMTALIQRRSASDTSAKWYFAGIVRPWYIYSSKYFPVRCLFDAPFSRERRNFKKLRTRGKIFIFIAYRDETMLDFLIAFFFFNFYFYFCHHLRSLLIRMVQFFFYLFIYIFFFWYFVLLLNYLLKG